MNENQKVVLFTDYTGNSRRCEANLLTYEPEALGNTLVCKTVLAVPYNVAAKAIEKFRKGPSMVLDFRASTGHAPVKWEDVAEKVAANPGFWERDEESEAGIPGRAISPPAVK